MPLYPDYHGNHSEPDGSWLCGAHAGLRLAGEALGLKWGAVDFNALVLRPYDNWVLEALDTTKTSDSEAIPMTPRLARALARLKKRGYAIADGDFVFVTELQPDRPVRDKPLREAFKLAREAAGLKPIKPVQPPTLLRYEPRGEGRRRAHDPGADASRPPNHDRTVHGLRTSTRACESDHASAGPPQSTRERDPDSCAPGSIGSRALGGGDTGQ
jgi:integrase